MTPSELLNEKMLKEVCGSQEDFLTEKIGRCLNEIGYSFSTKEEMILISKKIGLKIIETPLQREFSEDGKTFLLTSYIGAKDRNNNSI